MRIADLDPANESHARQMAELLVAGFAHEGEYGWPDMASAMEEVEEFKEEGRILRGAFEGDILLGWVGGISVYHGHTWELHPLVVRPDAQGRGIGRALVADFEEQVRARGGTAIHLGTDDTANRTSLGGANLYENLWEQVAGIRNLGGHPYEFYQKCGYAITGVIPDANGPGKPDIFMCKRVGE
ncbi:MAG: GNAT family N-acetyltransferase [Chloroflexi bacterium]|nr:GNAT family N-acetyltransferase [Chloroflexota bacterium]